MIDDLRNKIDAVDNEILSKFIERMNLSKEIAEYKADNSLSVSDPERERHMMRKLIDSIDDKELSHYVYMLFQTILAASKSYQNKLVYEKIGINMTNKDFYGFETKPFPDTASVACQGIEGSNTQIACEKMIKMPDIVYYKTEEGVFNAVNSGLCDYGVISIENSTSGSVNSIYRLLSKYRFYIVKSISLKIEHALLCVKGARLEDVKHIISHDLALSQCSGFIESLDVTTSPSLNTSYAAKTVAERHDKSIACIGPESAAEIYGLNVIKRSIQNDKKNVTKFICFSKKLEIYPGSDRTSICLTLPNKVGAANDVVSRFSANGINIIKIESRKIPESDTSLMLYIDMQEPVSSECLKNLLAELERDYVSFSFLGSYRELS